MVDGNAARERVAFIGWWCWGILAAVSAAQSPVAVKDWPSLQPVHYNHPGLVVDLGAGLWAWPIPMDFDNDGDLDLLVSCPDKPYHGLWYFENPGGDRKFPVFKPAQRISRGLTNVSPSYVAGKVRILSPGQEYPDFLLSGLHRAVKLPLPANIHSNRVRANQWKYVDYNGDGLLDLTVGVGDWTDYGWDNAYDATGRWQRGPLHGYVYIAINEGTAVQPRYATPRKILAGGKVLDVFGMPSPNFADFDADGDLDLLCGEFLDGFTYFENTGDRSQPLYSTGKRLYHDGKPLVMDLQMIVPVALDWDSDGDIDLVVGDEDGRVALVEATGKIVDRMPVFLPPRYFQQEADLLKCGALATPVGVDWDGDGDDDILSGNTAGTIQFFTNLSGRGVASPRWGAPVDLAAAGKKIRIQAGPNGSIQGPCEAKWGYTTLAVADWNHDGLPDLIVNSILGKVQWYRNIGTRQHADLAAAESVEVQWPGVPPKPAWVWWQPLARELCTQWRTTPLVVDWNNDGKNDLVMLDHEGYLVFFERILQGNKLALLPGQRVFYTSKEETFRPNPFSAGRSGRRKFCTVDWDGDGLRDLFMDSINSNWWRQQPGQAVGQTLLHDMGPMSDRVLAGHDTSPTTVDWNADGIPDLLIGAEDGHFYHLTNPRTGKAKSVR